MPGNSSIRLSIVDGSQAVFVDLDRMSSPVQRGTPVPFDAIA